MSYLPAAVPAVIAAFVALVAAMVVTANRRERGRRQTLLQWAASHSWAYAERPAPVWTARLPGRNRRGVTLVLSGVVDGYPVSMAEYFYTQSRGGAPDADGATMGTTTTTRHLIVVVLRLPRPGPAMEVAHRHALSKLGRAIFGEGGTATGYQPFDAEFRVRCKDPDAVRRLVGPLLAAEHVAGRVPAWTLEGDELLAYQPGRIGDPASVPGMVAPLARVATLLGR